MSLGTVKWFDSKKGFGFIVNGSGRDVFVHFSSIQGEGFRFLCDGESVDYDEVNGTKGLSAQNVRRVAAPPPDGNVAPQLSARPPAPARRNAAGRISGPMAASASLNPMAAASYGAAGRQSL